MFELLRHESCAEYEAFLKANRNGHLLQSPAWARLKNNWSSHVIVSRDETGRIRAGVLVLCRRLPGMPYAMLYAPRGPVCEPSEYARLTELAEGIRHLARRKKAFVFKSDPAIASSDEAFLGAIREAGFRVNDTGPNFDGIQAKYVMRVDLKDKTEAEVLAGFHSKTRYNIRLAARRGVTVRQGTRDDLPEFFRLMAITGRRDCFQIRPLSYFERMCDAMDSEELRIYLAEWEGQVISAVMMGSYGNKAWYLYGASDDAHRDVMPNYLVQWTIIKQALLDGRDLYDLRGVTGDDDPSNPLYGLYRFKKGFAGERTEFVGEVEMVFRPIVYRAFTLLMKVRKQRMKKRCLREKTVTRPWPYKAPQPAMEQAESA